MRVVERKDSGLGEENVLELDCGSGMVYIYQCFIRTFSAQCTVTGPCVYIANIFLLLFLLLTLISLSDKLTRRK